MKDDPFYGLPDMVPRGRKYANAPIAEATIDFRVSLSDDLELDALARIYAPEWGKPEPFYALSATVSPAGVVSNRGEQVGYTYDRDGHHVIRAARDRFAYSRTEKYVDWDSFISDVEHCWHKYRNATRPRHVERLGARYVNVINIPRSPAAGIEINDYLRTKLDVSSYLPQSITGYFTQVRIPISRFGVDATITTALPESDDPNHTSIVLDIDVTRSVDLAPEGEGFSDTVRQELLNLREAKNYVFEACITDATRGVIDRGLHASGAAEPEEG